MDKPEFILNVSLARGESTSRIHGFTDPQLRKIVELFGKRGAITNMGSTYDKCIREGAKPFTDWVANLICETMMTNPNVQKYYASSMRESDIDSLVPSSVTDLVTTCFTEPVLAKEYGIWADLTDEERFIVEMWDAGVVERVMTRIKADPVKAYLNTIPQTKEVMAFYQLVENNHLLRLINAEELATAVSQKDTLKAAQAVNFIKSILK